MPKLTINGMEIEVEKGTSIIQAAEMLGIEIPRFCYHDKLSVPANCRMCLVQVEGGPPKPQASCALACGEGMVVHTDSPMVQKARKGVMEMLLINHPLDCPICDQGGECDLQDQAVAYGMDRSRYHENKRAVKDKELGPLIETTMTRCINCTRCVRFAEEIAGTPDLGQFFRGEDAEIGTFIDKIVDTELSGNLIDICPVGALTSKPYAFKARSWELKKTESIDVHDALGSNIRIDARGNEVMRILPRLNEDINEEWISDRTRFAYDGLKYGRLDRPYIRDKDTGKRREASWDEAFALIAENLKGLSGENIAALAGDLADVESMYALKQLMTALGSPHIDCRTDGSLFDASERAGYIFNSGIAGIEQADAIILIGTNPRHEATLVNARIRKTWMERGTPVYRIGASDNLTYPVIESGAAPQDIEKLIKDIKGKYTKPMIIAGAGCLRRADGEAVHKMLHDAAEKLGCITEGWNGFNILHSAASRVGGLDIGFIPQKDGRGFADIVAGTKDGSIKALYMLGADEFDARSELGWKTFIIYQGHHGDRGAAMADVILPGAAYTEKDATYVNTEGRVQLARRSVFPPGEAKEDWAILRALSERLGKSLPFDTLMQLRTKLVSEYNIFAQGDVLQQAQWKSFGGKGKAEKEVFLSVSENYYLTNSIARASKTMQQCAGLYSAPQVKEAAE